MERRRQTVNQRPVKTPNIQFHAASFDLRRSSFIDHAEQCSAGVMPATASAAPVADEHRIAGCVNRMALSGVRISWLMLARNRILPG